MIRTKSSQFSDDNPTEILRRKKLSEAHKKLWQNKSFREKMIKVQKKAGLRTYPIDMSKYEKTPSSHSDGMHT